MDMPGLCHISVHSENQSAGETAARTRVSCDYQIWTQGRYLATT
jgi:hypothetical protein